MTAKVSRVFRFAPSPNGFLHLGHAYSALLNAHMAGASGGRLLLRIEDIDRERSRPAFEAAIFEDLAWLGLDWEKPVVRQSDRLDSYAAALAGLRARGLAYPCFCSRAEIAAARRNGRCDPDGAPLYPGTCGDLPQEQAEARIAAGERFAVRLDMTRALAAVAAPLTFDEFHEGEAGESRVAQPALWGDALIGRRDVAASYHLACVLDDAAQRITDVVRGADLEAATGLHRLLQQLLGLPTPRYRHHRLVLGADGRKFSKSKGSPALRDWRAKGATPQDVRAELARRMGRPV